MACLAYSYMLLAVCPRRLGILAWRGGKPWLSCTDATASPAASDACCSSSPQVCSRSMRSVLALPSGRRSLNESAMALRAAICCGYGGSLYLARAAQG
eukprot:1443948-Pleurochrysis_carterae.AAC.3